MKGMMGVETYIFNIYLIICAILYMVLIYSYIA